MTLSLLLLPLLMTPLNTSTRVEAVTSRPDIASCGDGRPLYNIGINVSDIPAIGVIVECPCDVYNIAAYNLRFEKFTPKGKCIVPSSYKDKKCGSWTKNIGFDANIEQYFISGYPTAKFSFKTFNESTDLGFYRCVLYRKRGSANRIKSQDKDIAAGVMINLFGEHELDARREGRVSSLVKQEEHAIDTPQAKSVLGIDPFGIYDVLSIEAITITCLLVGSSTLFAVIACLRCTPHAPVIVAQRSYQKKKHVLITAAPGQLAPHVEIV